MTTRALVLRAGRAVDGLGLGRHPLRRRGQAQSFREHRPYDHGDDLRHIDWHAYARHDALFIKVFEDEAPIRVELVLDSSGSMAYADKAEAHHALALSIARLALGAGEEAGLTVVQARASGPVHRLVPTATGGGRVHQVAAALQACAPQGASPLGEALTQLGRRLPRRSHIMVLSDFLVPHKSLHAALAHLDSRRHDVTLINLWHPDELALPFTGRTRFRGLEEEGERVLHADDQRAAYLRAVTAHQSALTALGRQHHAAVVHGHTAESTTVLLRRVVLSVRPKRRAPVKR